MKVQFSPLLLNMLRIEEEGDFNGIIYVSKNYAHKWGLQYSDLDLKMWLAKF